MELVELSTVHTYDVDTNQWKTVGNVNEVELALAAQAIQNGGKQ